MGKVTLLVLIACTLGACSFSVSWAPVGDGQEIVQSTTNKVLDNTKAKESRY